MPAWLFTPTGILGALLAAASIYGVVITKMYGGLNERFSDFKSAVVAAQKQAEEQAELERTRQERLLADYGQRWAAALAADRAVRVRQPANRCPGQMPGISPTATSHEGLQAGSGAGGYLEITLDQCEALANDSILDAEWIHLVKQLTDELHGAGK